MSILLYCDGKQDRIQMLYKRSKLFIGLCIVCAIILLVNTIIYLAGIAIMLSSSSDDKKHMSTRLIFLVLRGLTITGSDVFAGIGICQTRGSKFWVAFGFTVMSLILSIVNSALSPSTLSRVDLDFDILCFFMVLVLIREVYQLKNIQREERQVIHGIQS